MNDQQQRAAAKAFAAFWKDKGDEKQDAQNFWRSLLQTVFGMTHPETAVDFEYKVKNPDTDTTIFIDAYIRDTKVLVEQKGCNVDLKKGYRQSDGSVLTPFQQARRYAAFLPHNRNPRWIVVCNFKEFHIHNMNTPNAEPEIVRLEDLATCYHQLSFLVDSGNENIKREEELSIQAGEIVGKLYDALAKQYHDIDDPLTQRSLNVLCVRLVFCFYAEDANTFGKHLMFHDYMKQFDAKHFRSALIELFKVLDTKIENRDPYMDDDLAAFPYVNGGLFADEHIVIPQITDEIRTLILENASEKFDWSAISPTIFGAVFESTLNPETRRSGGMHYTSIENIHKVIDPLFLDDLKAEFREIAAIKTIKTRDEKLERFADKLSSLCFLDPAAGSGNFLTETYISLRRLENEALKLRLGNQIAFLADFAEHPIKVKISQFYGIEINDFAVTVAKAALWIAESQMKKETENILNSSIAFFPLETNATIIEGNALRLDWNEVVPKEKLSYIMGNPPFVGQQLRKKEQSDDMAFIFGKGSPETKLDYVLCWYKKAITLMKSIQYHPIKAAFVSTNSICQGESVPTFWKNMFDEGLDIGFARTSFSWKNESTDSATVVCIVIGFSYGPYNHQKTIYTESGSKKANHINAYLIDAGDIWITSRKNIPQPGFPKMIKGSEPSDGGDLFLSSEKADELLSLYPGLKEYIKPFVGGDEFLNSKPNTFSRYCFWFEGGNPDDYVMIKDIRDRLERIAQKRASSSADRIRKRAAYPYLFCQIRQPKTKYLLFPRHSSHGRKYIPLGFMSPDVIVGDACYILPSDSLYLFGVLMSDVHMAWTSLVCGRLGNGYRYSPAIYNNFPMPNASIEQKAKIEKTAQGILDARDLYRNSSLSSIYNDLTMPPELRKAHRENDKAVMQAYGFDWRTMTESACVAELMKLYQKLTAEA